MSSTLGVCCTTPETCGQPSRMLLIPVAEGGKLFIAIYNDQGTASRRWTKVKKLYNRLPKGLQVRGCVAFFLGPELALTGERHLRGKPFKKIRDHGKTDLRGMSFWQDLIDWVGGYPFEVATPGQIFDFYRERGFLLTKLRTCGGSLGCNEFVFEKR